MVYEPPLSSYVFAAVVAAITSGVLVGLLLRVPFALDKPNSRSLHVSPTPCTGGLGLVAGMLLGTGISIGLMQPAIWIALGLAVLSLVDDRWHVPVLVRLSGHLLATALFVFLLGDWPSMLVIMFLILGLGWMTNLYNFMDGADGLAGGMTVFGFGAYAIAAGLQGHNDIGALALCVASAGAGFLVFNFPPARIFMGDVGAIPIGFLAGAIGLLGWREGVWPPVFPVVVFAPFIADATVTLAKRAMRKEPVWRAHREHYYQRLILGGWSHRRAAVAEYVLMAVCAVAGLFVVFAEPAAQITTIVTLMLILIVLMAMVDRRWRLQQRMESM